MTTTRDIVRMTVQAQQNNEHKIATSILRDWNKPNSWSTGTLRASAQDWLDNAQHDVLSLDQLVQLRIIANGTAERPQS